MKKRAQLGTTGVFAEPVTPPPSGPRPDRIGRVAMPFWTTEAARRQLRQMALDEDTTSQAFMTEALNDFFQKRGKPPIA